jgi:hypothetical protein
MEEGNGVIFLQYEDKKICRKLNIFITIDIFRGRGNARAFN